MTVSDLKYVPGSHENDEISGISHFATKFVYEKLHTSINS